MVTAEGDQEGATAEAIYQKWFAHARLHLMATHQIITLKINVFTEVFEDFRVVSGTLHDFAEQRAYLGLVAFFFIHPTIGMGQGQRRFTAALFGSEVERAGSGQQVTGF